MPFEQKDGSALIEHLHDLPCHHLWCHTPSQDLAPLRVERHRHHFLHSLTQRHCIANRNNQTSLFYQGISRDDVSSHHGNTCTNSLHDNQTLRLTPRSKHKRIRMVKQTAYTHLVQSTMKDNVRHVRKQSTHSLTTSALPCNVQLHIIHSLQRFSQHIITLAVDVANSQTTETKRSAFPWLP